MATLTLTVPDTEVELFLTLLETSPMLRDRVTTVVRLSPAIEAHDIKRARFMNQTTDLGDES